MRTLICLSIVSCEGCGLYSNGAGFDEPSCGHPNRYKDGYYVSSTNVPDSCPARLHPIDGYKCTCHERDGSYKCTYCTNQEMDV